MIKGTVDQEVLVLIEIDTLNIGSAKFVRLLTNLEKRMDGNLIVERNFNHYHHCTYVVSLISEKTQEP